MVWGKSMGWVWAGPISGRKIDATTLQCGPGLHYSVNSQIHVQYKRIRETGSVRI